MKFFWEHPHCNLIFGFLINFTNCILISAFKYSFPFYLQKNVRKKGLKMILENEIAENGDKNKIER